MLTYTSRRASIYLVTLITVAAIVSMILIGVTLRSASNTQSALIEEMSESSNGVLDVAEYSFQKITSDSQWKTNAQTGMVLSDFPFGDSTYTSTILDADTGVLPTYDTTTYRVTVAAESDIVSNSASIDVFTSKYDYITLLQSISATHYWPLDERSNPANAVDGIGTYTGAYLVPSVAGKSTNDEGGLVPVFADANDYISVPWGNDFDVNSGSFSMWVKRTGSDDFNNFSFLGMDYKLNEEPSINMAIQDDNVFVYIDETGDDTGTELSTTSGPITLGVWHHVVVCFGASGLCIYVDGVERAWNNLCKDGLSTGGGPNGKQPLRIGSGFNMFRVDNPEDGFVGSISHVVFFDKHLNIAQIANLAAIKPDLLSFSLVDNTWVRVFE